MIRFDGKRAVVWGLGQHGGGVAVTRYLAQRGARVHVIDAAREVALADSLRQLDGVENVTIATDCGLIEGSNGPADLLVVNPAIPTTHPDLLEWRRRYPTAMVSSEINLLLAELRTQAIDVLAVTGSNGKTSVCQWLARLLARSGRWSAVLLGGNFEPGLCSECEENLLERVAGETTPVEKPAIAVLELSSFQLATCDDEFLRPLVGAVTNVSRNHLDWHDSFDAYVAAKGRLVDACEAAGRPCVLPLSEEDPLRRRYAGAKFAIVPEHGNHGERLSSIDAINAATVTSVGRAIGCDWSSDELLATRPAVPHRREYLGVVNGVQFVNDSSSTTPESTIALLESLNSRGCGGVGLIAGGRNKGFDLAAFAERLGPSVGAVACLGETSAELQFQLSKVGVEATCHAKLAGAVETLLGRPGPLDVVALSPGMASTDMFRDYRDRGDRFRQIVQQLAGSDSGHHPMV